MLKSILLSHRMRYSWFYKMVCVIFVCYAVGRPLLTMLGRNQVKRQTATFSHKPTSAVVTYRYPIGNVIFSPLCTIPLPNTNLAKVSSSQHSIAYKFCSNSNNGTCKKGKPFDAKLITRYGIDRIGDQLVSFSDFHRKHMYSSVAMTTGASSNHFIESKAAIATAQKTFGCLQIIFWDLGLTQQEHDEMSSLCGVVVRTFNFSAYPKHVSDLHTYAWKPLIWLHLLEEYAGVVWFDASIRFDRTDFFTESYKHLLKSGGNYMYSWGHALPYNFTHPGTFEYLPTDDRIFKKKLLIGESGGVAMIKTKKIYEGVLYWLWLCALTEECISPRNSTLNMKPKEGIHTHRYDQSVLGILQENLHEFQTTRYMNESFIMKVRREDNVLSKVVLHCI